MLREDWRNCKDILCIRPDNMGDLLMSVPAIRALKESSGAKITVLTSSMAAGIARMIPEVDEVIVFDLPWVKAKAPLAPDSLNKVIKEIQERDFDAAVVFTVYSQNPLPTVMLAYLAGIPRRLGYCRENPYELLTDWVPDKEPYSQIKHQVRRDLDLVAGVGALTSNEKLFIEVDESRWTTLSAKLQTLHIATERPWIILHPGVSEQKREYPLELWIEAGIALANDYQLLITGGPSEKCLTDKLKNGIGERAFSLAGELELLEFILLVKKAPLVISVNTGTIHLAAATQTPVVVLYALTNPQHFPWKTTGKVLTFDVPEEMRSRNEIINFVNEKYFSVPAPMVKPQEIVDAVRTILSGDGELIPELPI
ncbi:lipopolysaccharide heptosyltransferase II [Arcticibacter tournemirensis]|uniref:Glycosyltransferase family 9 protein n=1 Tax=Arcticibacter tournemirensis TaxID=699437 RepID=A0A5M9HHD4_9SPHI|nr:glycosyltransferase family 9 protein [Arcticibacter tournemirensis]KAA8484387.1 glycosyltransferase family 9 protein [Arcticibacter tournemirensis]TQM49829.1 lipopolysaccharide heptosyltransferase II [Arcticibacter tournemirensis]